MASERVVCRPPLRSRRGTLQTSAGLESTSATSREEVLLRLSSVSSERRGFLERLRMLQQWTSGSPWLPFTNPNGPGSLVGVINRVSIHAR